ncbi:hypothetical protein AHAS_Ahas11G0215300 [Arachis hypogaea]
MFLRSTTYITDAKKGFAIFRFEVLEHVKELKEAKSEAQSLNGSLIILKEEKQSLQAKVATLEEAKNTSEERYKKHISKLMRHIDDLSTSIKKAE